jgi:hypothetical protein
MLVELRVFENIPEPWFPIKWNPELQDYTGEDWAFCEQLEERGIPIYVDMQLSKHIGHVGAFTYEHKHVERRQGNGRAGESAGFQHSYEFGVSAPGDVVDEGREVAATRAEGGD